MIRRCLSALACVVLAVPLIFIFSFLFGLVPGSSSGGTLASGRSVITHSDSIYLTTLFDNDTATIKTAFKTIIVKPTGLFVNGSSVATIDPKVSRVEVRVKNGTINFVADGRSVASTIR